MAFIIFLNFFLKKFEKVEKTGIISKKFSLRCTPSVILGSREMAKTLKGSNGTILDQFGSITPRLLLLLLIVSMYLLTDFFFY